MNENLIFSINNLKSKILQWKIIAFVAILLMIFIVSSLLVNKKSNANILKNPYIARMEINGVIMDDQERINKLIQIRDDSKALGLIVSVDSPGGGVIASQNIYNLLNEIKKNKPVVVSMKNVAASGGYLLSLAADKIFAYDSTITGSIGVIFQYFEAVDFVERLGIRPKMFKSSPLKASPSMWEHQTKDNSEVYRNLIKDTYISFANLVKENRNFDCNQLKKTANGAIFSGIRAFELGLIDQLGNEKQALNWLKQEIGLTEEENKKNSTKVIDFKYMQEEKSLFRKIFGKLNKIIDTSLQYPNYQLMAIM